MMSYSTSAPTKHNLSSKRVDLLTPAPRLSRKKRLFDLLFSLLVIVFMLSWMIPLAGLMIRLTSAGPVIFVQLRSGRNGQPFRCLKFRTMYYDKQAHFSQAVRNDPRVTWIGSFLRRTNLDEMPQFINVLLGQMSIVGPRPHAVNHDAQFWFRLKNYPLRYQVTPGITGLAQVRGNRGLTSQLIEMEHRVRYDRFYISRRSLWFDLRICAWTVKKMLAGDKKAH
ncbi:sugar transferase [Arsenicibacter rosenii]|nr:sugar transferase [Arsenicibacter rosenii]